MEFAKGQPVTWPPAPGGLAQVVELRRTRVRLYYRARTGREFRPVVPAAALAAAQRAGQPPLPIHNPYGRAAMRGPPKEYAEGVGGRQRAVGSEGKARLPPLSTALCLPPTAYERSPS